jgi:hypothetical protein
MYNKPVKFSDLENGKQFKYSGILFTKVNDKQASYISGIYKNKLYKCAFSGNEICKAQGK